MTSIQKLLDPFGLHLEHDAPEGSIPNKSIFWMTYLNFENGKVISLSDSFYANVWPEFWPHVTKKALADISHKVLTDILKDKKLQRDPLDMWMMVTAETISDWLGWEREFFRVFPWRWTSLSYKSINAVVSKYTAGNPKPPQLWLKQFQDDKNVSDHIKTLEQSFHEITKLNQKDKTAEFIRQLRAIDESTLNHLEKFIVRDIKLRLKAMRTDEIPALKALNLANDLIRQLNHISKARNEDYNLRFRLGCEDDKNNQWLSIMKYKGFIGELIFAEHFGDIFDSIPVEDRVVDGLPIFHKETKFEYLQEHLKPSIIEIIESTAEENYVEVKLPSVIPLYFPDFHVVEVSETGVIFITLFECTWSRLNSKKVINDMLKWENFVTEFNKLNYQPDQNEEGYVNSFIILNVRPINVNTFVRKRKADMEITIRIEAVEKLIELYTQNVLSDDNPSILRTIDVCSTLRFPKETSRSFRIPEEVLDNLTDLVNADVEKDTKVKDYVKALEEEISEDQIEDFENELLEELHKKLSDVFIKNQKKWVLTNSANLHEGVHHIKSHMFCKERILRMVANNHHDDNQFTMINEGEDLTEYVNEFFNAVSDMLDSFQGQVLAKLKPTFCMLVHASAGHQTYLTTNNQFGYCAGIDKKPNRIKNIIAHLKSNFPGDARTEAIENFVLHNKVKAPVWQIEKYSLSGYKTHVDPVMMRLVVKKEENDYTYRFTDSTNCVLVNSGNFEIIAKPCCNNMNVRYDHQFNEMQLVCAKCKKRFRCPEPFEQLVAVIDERIAEKNGVDAFSEKEVVKMLMTMLKSDTLKLNIFLVGHILHFLIGMTENPKRIMNLIKSHSHRCHPIHQKIILDTISKKSMPPDDQKILISGGVVSRFRNTDTVRMVSHAKEIIEKWYSDNLKYVRDRVSRDMLRAELEKISSDNPFVVCLAELAEQMILSRSQYFTLANAVGYVHFSPAFGAIFSSGANPNSESIKSFGVENGHFFINHRTLRMIQGLPAMLISNKLLVDKMAKRKCEPGDYVRDDLIQFCMLNSRRMNVNLQNIRYFFMACWSNVHSPFLFKKLEMDFLKTSELKQCSKIVEYMETVLKNYDYEDPEIRDHKMYSEVSEDFPVLFNETIRTSLRNVDLCLHSFYMVHLFEKTIAGKVQEIRKVFKKFLKPKQAWMGDRKKFLDDSLSDEDITRYLRADGLEKDLKKIIDLTFKDMINHTNKYAGFDMTFIKAAAMRFDGYNKNEFRVEVRRPHSVSELLKATSTLKKFEPSVNFNKVCRAIDTKKKLENAMKSLDKDLISVMLAMDKDTTISHLFPKCCKVLNNIKRKDAVDLTDNAVENLKEALKDIKIEDLSELAIAELDKQLSESGFVQICENFTEKRHKLRNKKEELDALTTEFKSKFPNAYSLHEFNPVLSLLLFCDQMKWPLELIRGAIDEVKNSNGSVLSNDMSYALLLTAIKGFDKNSNYCVEGLFSSLDKDRTPRNKTLKRRVQQCTSFLANPRSMTTALINDILSLMNDDTFSDTYTVCAEFKFNSDPILFAMAFKEQFGGERELTIGDIWSKLTLKLVEDIAKDLGRCMKNTCLNEPNNEGVFKDMVAKTQVSNKFVMESSEIGESTPYYYWSRDRSKWGPFHQGLAFYAVIRILLLKDNSSTEDVIDLVKYSCFKHAIKHFEIHHNIISSVFSKAMRKGVLYESEGTWHFDKTHDVRPDITLEDWEEFVILEVQAGKKSIHTRMDMGQGMLHSCSDVYGAVMDNYIAKLTQTYFRKYRNVNFTTNSMNTSDDSAAVNQFSGTGSKDLKDTLVIEEALLNDFFQRMGNMFVSEKSVLSMKMMEFKSSFMCNGEQIRVLIKFLSTQLTIGKDCLPEDFFNSYNSLSKSILNNGGSQMMTDLLYLTKLHQLQTVYSFSKSAFHDCVTDAPPSRFGFPNLTCADIYFHTTRHILASRVVRFLNLCGFMDSTITITRKVNEGTDAEHKISKKFRTTDDKLLPFSFVTHNGTSFETVAIEENYKTTIRLSEAKNDIVFNHSQAFTAKTLEENLVKFYTLARTPGSKSTESICCGVNTLLPSQRGKFKDIETVEHQSLRNMSYLDYFIMRKEPKSLKSAKMRSAQALFQSVNEDAKRAHQNMVFTKGKLINKGTFCFYGNKLVDLKTAHNTFNCDDTEYKCTLNLVKSMNHQFEPVKRLINHPLKTESSCVIELRDSTTTHVKAEIPLHVNQLGKLTYDPFMVRAYIRYSEWVENGEPISEEDTYIVQHMHYDVDKMNNDTKTYKSLFLKFTDTELMLLTLGYEKNVLDGVYMFEQSLDMKEQIGFILQGCIHNHIQRNITLPSSAIPERSLDIASIQKILLMTSIYSQETEDEIVLRKRLIGLFGKHHDLSSALLAGMEDSKYSYICSVIRLFCQPSDEHAHKLLLRRFKDLKNFEEIGTVDTRIWTGTCYGTRFKCIKDLEAQMVIDLKVSECSGDTQKKIIQRLRGVFELHNEQFNVTVDKTMPRPNLYADNEKQTVIIEFRNHKFVLCLAGEGRLSNTDFFSTCTNESERLTKWKNCVEVTCSAPTFTETSTLWDLINGDMRLKDSIRETNFTEFTLKDYFEQFERLERVVEASGPSNTTLRACLMNEPYQTNVIKDVVTKNVDKFCNLCPTGIVTATNPFVMSLLQAKLAANAKSQGDMMTIENFLDVIPDHMTKVLEVPMVKFRGFPLVAVGKMDVTEFKGIRLMGHNYLGNTEMLPKNLNDSIEGNEISEERYYVIFSRDVGIRHLFGFQDKDHRARICLLNIETGEVVFSDLSNSSKAEEYDNLIKANKSLRLGFVTPSVTREGTKKRLLLEL